MRDPHAIPEKGARVRYPSPFRGMVEAVVVQPGSMVSTVRVDLGRGRTYTTTVENQALEEVIDDA